MSPNPKNWVKCSICDTTGQKGFFNVPKESDKITPKRQWRTVISIAISSQTRVYFRHFARDELYLTLKGNVKIIEGKFCSFFQDQVQIVEIPKIGCGVPRNARNHTLELWYWNGWWHCGLDPLPKTPSLPSKILKYRPNRERENTDPKESRESQIMRVITHLDYDQNICLSLAWITEVKSSFWLKWPRRNRRRWTNKTCGFQRKPANFTRGVFKDVTVPLCTSEPLPNTAPVALDNAWALYEWRKSLPRDQSLKSNWNTTGVHVVVLALINWLRVPLKALLFLWDHLDLKENVIILFGRNPTTGRRDRERENLSQSLRLQWRIVLASSP